MPTLDLREWEKERPFGPQANRQGLGVFLFDLWFWFHKSPLGSLLVPSSSGFSSMLCRMALSGVSETPSCSLRTLVSMSGAVCFPG